MRRPSRILDFGPDFLAGAEAGIDQPPVLQNHERGPVIAYMLRLPAHRFLPRQPQPFQVFDDGGLELGPGTARVDVLDAQQQPAPRLFSLGVGEQRRVGVAQVQVTGGAGGEAGDGVHG